MYNKHWRNEDILVTQLQWPWNTCIMATDMRMRMSTRPIVTSMTGHTCLTGAPEGYDLYKTSWTLSKHLRRLIEKWREYKNTLRALHINKHRIDICIIHFLFLITVTCNYKHNYLCSLLLLCSKCLHHDTYIIIIKSFVTITCRHETIKQYWKKTKKTKKSVVFGNRYMLTKYDI